MELHEIREYMRDNGCEDWDVFEEPSYETAFIGISDEGRAVYDYDKMVVFAIFHYEVDSLEAMEIIDAITIQTMNLMVNPPVIVKRCDSGYAR